MIKKIKRNQILILKTKYYYMTQQKLNNGVTNLKKNRKDYIIFITNYLINSINLKTLREIF